MNEIRFETKKDWMGKFLLGGPTFIITILTVLRLSDVEFGKAIPPAESLIMATIFFWIFSIVTWNFTFYTLDGTTFTARFAYFKKMTVKLSDIKDIKTQEFGQWIYGLSKDVIVIRLNNGRELSISPLRANDLIDEIEKRKKLLPTKPIRNAG